MATRREPQPLFDRTPPHSLEAERSVLGAMLLNPDAVGTAIEVLHEHPEIFYSEAHQQVYAAMVKLFGKNTPVDAVTLVEQLTRDGHIESVGGVTYISDLAGAVPTSANVEHYAKIVLDTAVLRRLIGACARMSAEAYESPEDVSQLLDRAEADIFAIAETRQVNPIMRVSDLLEDTISRIEAIIKSNAAYTGMPSGFKRLDELLSGFQRSDMVVLAARPSVGKTAFALNIAAHLAVREGKSALVFSLEMSKEQLVQRLICMEARINSKRLRTGFLAKSEFRKLPAAADKLTRAKLYIDDTPNLGILDLRSKARRHASQNELDLIIIDYLQLMRGAGRFENRQTEIAEISRSVKGLARELRLPVIALSQLSREAERDDTGIPKLSHLRESGAIEQDADVVLMLSRPPAHKRGDSEEDDGEGEKIIHVTVAKQRNGPTGKLDLYFDRDIQLFMDPAEGVGEREADAAGMRRSPLDEEAVEEYEVGDEQADDGIPF